ncbi:MAG TPA: hypothetical protein VKT49_26470 [Bryobacteraceae bacterium]|nr:hypothetical protein [Bryobacteraceae bacterium]
MRTSVHRWPIRAALCCLIAAAGAQEKKPSASGAAVQPSEPAPRGPDGHVNLGSTPETKGYWEVRPGLGGFPRAADVPFQPWARAVYAYRQRTNGKDSPLVACKAATGPAFFNAPGFEIVDAPEQKKIFILNIAGPHSWRVIFMDGRPHPTGEALRPTFLGHSVGHWESDTLVIDTVGLNEKQWPVGSYPTTSQLHLTERIARPNLRTLSYEATIDDPGAYTKPWTVRWTINEKTASSWIAGGEIFEYICEDAGR